MKYFLLTLLFSLSLTGCKEDSDSSSGLAGKWQLTGRQCYCIAAPLPNETLTLTASNFTFFKDDQPVASGTYAPATTVPCGTTTAVAVLCFTYATGQKRDFMATVDEDTLVLDDGLQRKCLADADIVNTYQRLP